MTRITVICVAALAAALGGCAVAPTQVDTSAQRVDVDSYRLLADLAFARQRREEAAENYLEAALLAENPGFAEQAAQLAYGLGLDTLGHRAVARWQELDPDNPLAHYYAAVFEMRSGRGGAAVDEFSVLLDSLTNAQLGTGFALILDALISEPTADIAAAIMRELTSRYPPTREGHFGMAQLALRAGGFDLALAESSAAIELDPDWPDARLLHTRTLMLAGQSDEALAIASELADEYDNAQIRLQFAELLLSAGETERAQSLLNEILDENPAMPEAIRALAYLSLANDELEPAREYFEMLRNNPAFRDEAYFYLGRIAELESDYLRATRAYSRVTDGIRAVEAQVRAGAIMYQEMNDAESALGLLRVFGDANPLFAPEMLLARAQLLLDMERLEDAMSLITDAIGDDEAIADESLKNAHVQFYATLMEDSLDSRDLESAESWISEGLARYPGNPSLRYSQARLLQEQGRLRRAVRMLEDLVDESPDNPVFLNALGYLLTDKMQRHIEARRYIQRALAMDPESGAILDSMGWVLFRLGELELALEYLERAYRSLEVTEVMAHLIDVHWALGEQARALQMLDEALAESPDDPYLTDVRDRLAQ
jgi:tetratricopeptide (TPR) repeat protein